MLKLYASLKCFHECMIASQIDYAVIGGVAVAVWGEPRLTQDVDVKVLPGRKEAEKLLGALGTEYKPFGDNPLEMLNKNGILFVHDTNGVRIDIHLCDTAFDHSTIERATSIEIAPGSSVMVCSAEDLVIYKMLSTRPSDARDFEGIIDCQGDALDDQYIIYWLKQFEDAR